MASELRTLCDLALSLPAPRSDAWQELTRETYQEAASLARTSEWWAALARRMAKLNLPEDEDMHELEHGDWGDST